MREKGIGQEMGEMMSEDLKLLSKVVKMVRDRNRKLSNASPLVYYLGLAVLRDPEIRKPKIGDMVIEVTHLINYSKLKLGLLSAVGELISIEQDEEYGEAYVIKTIEGKEERWLNADIRVIG